MLIRSEHVTKGKTRSMHLLQENNWGEGVATVLLRTF